MRSNYHNLPTVNGQEQQFGKKYKATKIQVNEKKKIVSMDLAKAYSEKSEIITWKRTYQLKKDKLVVKDDYKLNKVLAHNQIHFMLWQNVELKEGRALINVKEKKMELLYDKNQFSAHVDTIPLPDVRLSKVWKNEIYRLTLTDKKSKRKGHYKYIICKIKQDEK